MSETAWLQGAPAQVPPPPAGGGSCGLAQAKTAAGVKLAPLTTAPAAARPDKTESDVWRDVTHGGT